MQIKQSTLELILRGALFVAEWIKESLAKAEADKAAKNDPPSTR